MSNRYAYMSLVARVRRINLDAADYLLELLRSWGEGTPPAIQVGFTPEPTLGESFIWSQTPQGAKFWLDIAVKVEKEPHQ